MNKRALTRGLIVTFIVVFAILVFLQIGFIGAAGGSFTNNQNINWGNFKVFGGSIAPYASNGPGCKMGMGFSGMNMTPGMLCPQSNDVAYDLGAVWVDLDSNYIAWQIKASNLTNAGICGGARNSDNLGVSNGWAISVEFDVDSNMSTGCRMPNQTLPFGERCFPGSEYRFYVYGNNATLFEIYNRSLGTCTGESPTCFNALSAASGLYNVSYNVNCSGQSNILRIAINKSSVSGNTKLANMPALSGMRFQTVSMGGANMGPADMLGGFDSGTGGFVDNIMSGGQKDMMFQGVHPCRNITNSSRCTDTTNVSNVLYTCQWDSFQSTCNPKFVGGFGGGGMTCNDFCGACNTTATCQSGGRGKCKVVTAPSFLPMGVTAFETNNMCVEDPTKFTFGGGSGGSCDSDCKYCSSVSTCGNSTYANPNGESGAGCKWITDSQFGKSWCDIVTFDETKLSCGSEALDKCLNSSLCSGAGGNWTSQYNVCFRNATAAEYLCFDGVDNDGNGQIDCADSVCNKESFCGGDINILTDTTLASKGGANFLDNPYEAMKFKMFDGMDPSPPVTLATQSLNATLHPIIDIRKLMIKDMGSALGFGIGVTGLVNRTSDAGLSLLCNGTSAGRYYYAIDSDANLTSGCNVTIAGANYTGFEYRFEYFVENNGSNSAREIRRGYKCVPSTSSFVLFPAKMAGAPEMNFGGFGGGQPQKVSCIEDVAILAIDKVDLGNSKDKMRLMVATSDNSTSYTSAVNANDTLLGNNNGGVYYTPGSMDFRPTDCSQNPMACGTAFSVIGGGKFMPFEDCFPSSGDEDMDGLSNCADSDCSMAPWCSGTDYTTNDKTAPTMYSNKVESFPDFVFAHWTTNEPTNATFSLYGNCMNSTASNTIIDIGRPGAFDDYRPWHDLGIKNGTNDSNGANSAIISIVPGSLFYYKIAICDKANNCGTSACLNFTAPATTSAVNYRMDFAPSSNAMQNTTQFKLWNGTGYETITASQTMNKSSYLADAKLKFDNTENNWSIELGGIDLAKAVNFNLTGAFNVTRIGQTPYVGISNQIWLEMVQSLGADNVTIQIPSLGTRLTKCNENNLSDCSDVSSQATLMETNQTGGFTKWSIPSSLGFSTYTVAGGTENYTLIFRNLSVSEVTGNVVQNLTYRINITNNDSAARIYNLTVIFNSTIGTPTGWVNGSTMQQISLGSNSSVALNINVTNTYAETIKVYVRAVLANDSGVLLNSSTDINLTATFLNNIAPTLHLISPANNSYINANTNVFYCNISQSYGPLANISISVYNATALINNTLTSVSGTFNSTNWTIPLSVDTNYTWGCFGRDLANNFAWASEVNYSVAYDGTYPLISFNDSRTDASGTNFSRNWIYMNVNVTETNEANITFTLYNATALVNATAFSDGTTRAINWTGLANGVYTYNATLVDKSNNRNTTATRTITLDNTNPNATLTSPTNASYSSNVSIVNFTANLSDALGIKNATLYVYNTTGLYNQTSTTFIAGVTQTVLGIVVNLVNDVYTWFYSLTDWAGNIFSTGQQAGQNRTLTADDIYSLLSFGYPTAYLNLSTRVIPINLTTSDTNFNNSIIVIYNSTWGSVNTTTNSTQNVNLSLSVNADGVYNINVTTTDLAGNVNRSGVMVTVDTLNPSISYGAQTETDGSYILRTGIIINVSASDDGVGLANITIFLYNSTNVLVQNLTNSTSSLAFANWTSLPDGNYYFNATATDKLNKINNTLATRNVTIDTTYPLISFNDSRTDASGTNFSRNWIYMNVNVTETNEANITFTLYNATALVNATAFSDGTNRSINWTGLANGVYTYNATVVDRVNYRNTTSTRTITLDTTAPAIALINNQTNKTYYANQTIQLYFRAADALIGVNGLWYRYNNGTADINAIAVATNPLSANINYTFSGQKNITFYANDSLNNLANTTIAIYNITLQPTATVIANSTSQTINENTTTNIVMAYNSTLQNISISSAVASNQSSTLDLTQLLESGTVSLGVNQFILERQSSTRNYSVVIPANTNVSGGSAWAGTITLPIVNSSTFTAPGSGTGVVAIDVGSSGELNFTSPVKIIIGGMGGKSAAWARENATLTNITTICNDTIPTNINSTRRECFNNTGSDLIIWTYHFTTFAAFTPPAAAVAVVAAADTPGSGSGTYVPPFWTSTYVYNDKEFSEMPALTREMPLKERVTIKIGGVQHEVGVIALTATTATINVSSTPQQATLNIGESKKFEVTNDSYYDIKVTLNSITNSKAKLTIEYLHEIKAAGEEKGATPGEGKAGETPKTGDGKAGETTEKASKWYLWVLLIIVVALIIWMIARSLKRKRY